MPLPTLLCSSVDAAQDILKREKSSGAHIVSGHQFSLQIQAKWRTTNWQPFPSGRSMLRETFLHERSRVEHTESMEIGSLCKYKQNTGQRIANPSLQLGRCDARHFHTREVEWSTQSQWRSVLFANTSKMEENELARPRRIKHLRWRAQRCFLFSSEPSRHRTYSTALQRIL